MHINYNMRDYCTICQRTTEFEELDGTPLVKCTECGSIFMDIIQEIPSEHLVVNYKNGRLSEWNDLVVHRETGEIT